ncbi:hypothetical protein [Niallia sp. 03133]|uniref:hypothetical protein n=1 Tax=Niallia sp. 03133 TaxID=3458060 RepID=UPI004044FD8B
MISYKREIRLRDLEVYLIFKENISMGYLIIEDLRRPLGQEELTISPYKYMDEEDIEGYRNLIKIDILSDAKLTEEDQELYREFAYDLVDRKDFCALKINYTVDSELFKNLPLDLEVKDYQEVLKVINSKYDISNLNLDNLMYLSQD